ncbi:MAG: glycerol-3-phosphate dehydrogenase, partial [Acidobacteriota bacterium]
MGPDVVVLGGGSWGTALALHLVRQGKRTRLWVHDADLARALSSHHENSKYLPGYRLPSDLEITADMGQALTDARDVLLVVPSHHCRRVLQAARPHVTGGMGFCSASKGIEEGTLLRVSEVIRDVLGDLSAGGVAALSGPSFAREVAEGHPTAVVVSAGDREQGRRLQQLLSGGAVRVYTNDDLVGTEF